jgi:DNA-binding GntR family transcriptional regulator
MTDSATQIPKYRQVYNSLRAEISAGAFASGQRLPSEADLVKTFGASRITVGRALRDLQQEGLVERRVGSGTYVRHHREHAAAGRFSLGVLNPHLV